MTSKLSRTGYLMIDERNSPGMPADVLAAAAKAGKEVIGAPKGQLLEMDVFSCSHCQKCIIKNPQRTRERAFCPKCGGSTGKQDGAYLCDLCGAEYAKTGICRNFKRIVEEVLGAASKAEAPNWTPNLVGLDTSMGSKLLTG